MAPSLGAINVLEQLAELGKPDSPLDDWLLIKDAKG